MIDRDSLLVRERREALLAAADAVRPRPRDRDAAARTEGALSIARRWRPGTPATPRAVAP